MVCSVVYLVPYPPQVNDENGKCQALGTRKRVGEDFCQEAQFNISLKNLIKQFPDLVGHLVRGKRRE